MNTLFFKYAIEVDRTRSITQAAENLFMAQPNLSKAIKETEEMLGYEIFARTSKGVAPTEKGAEFLKYARNIMKQLDLIAGEGHYTAILCPEGELFIADKAKRQREGYLAEITRAGAEFAQNRALSEETKKRIAKPILSPKGFETITLAHWGMNK